MSYYIEYPTRAVWIIKLPVGLYELGFFTFRNRMLKSVPTATWVPGENEILLLVMGGL